MTNHVTACLRGSSAAERLKHILVLVVCLLVDASQEFRRPTSTPSVFHMLEEQPIGTFVGNVKENQELLALYANYDVIDRLLFAFRSSTSSLPYRYFAIDERTGVITTRERVDRENLCPADDDDVDVVVWQCTVTLDVVIRPAQYYQIIRVVVNVGDVNDHAPTFADAALEFRVRESAAAGSVVFEVPPAVDGDGDVNGVQNYYLVSGSDKFELAVDDDEDGGGDGGSRRRMLKVRLVDGLDRELESNYSLAIVAVDGGDPLRSGSVDVTVFVDDVNDNAPEFESLSYEIELPESLLPPALLVRVRAVDVDAGENAAVRYDFAEHHTSSDDEELQRLFRIDHATGEIRLVSTLDYERRSVYQLTVVARDLGEGSRPATANVKVIVLDENDGRPQIVVDPLTESGRIEIFENAAAGTLVAYVTVRDEDAGDNGRVSCSVDAADLFRLKPVYASEFKLASATTFDRETRSEYDLVINCSDAGTPPLSVARLLQIYVLDENDHAPLLEKRVFIVDVEEGNEIGLQIADIVASDEDTGRNGELVYRLKELDDDDDDDGDGGIDHHDRGGINYHSGTLSIDPALGTVSADVVFDFEMRREYRFEVVVSDRGEPPLSASASLVLRILDANDERPQFEDAVYRFRLTENVPVGTYVGSVVASDLDSSPAFSRITYSLLNKGGGGGAFQLDPVTGVLLTARQIDREKKNRYEFMVVAANVGYPQIADRANVTVDVEDVNDNAPDIRFPSAANHDVFLPDGDRPPAAGSVLARVDARDADVGDNARLSFSISGGNDEGTFAIDQATGVVRFAGGQQLSDPAAVGRLHGGKSFRLAIAVADAGNPQLVSAAELVVWVDHSRQESHSSSLPEPPPSPSQNAAGGGHQSSGLLSAMTGENLAVLLGIFVVLVVVVVVIVLIIFCLLRCRVDVKRKEWQRRQEAAGAAAAAAAAAAAVSAATAKLRPPSGLSSRRGCSDSLAGDFLDSQRSLEWKFARHSVDVAPATGYSTEREDCSVYSVARHQRRSNNIRPDSVQHLEVRKVFREYVRSSGNT